MEAPTPFEMLGFKTHRALAISPACSFLKHTPYFEGFVFSV